MNTSEIIFIDFPINKYLYGLYVNEVYIRKPLSKALRFLRKLPLFSMLISNTREIKGWTISCKYAKTIIIFDTFANYALYCHKIEKEASKEARLILYLLNPVFFSDDYKLLSSRWEIWTFMEEDARKYGLKYGATFYNPLLLDHTKTLPTSKQTSDLLFIGTDKGRKDFILHLKDQLKAYGIRCDFRIVDNFKSLFSRVYSREVDYVKLCQLTNNTHAILDVVQKAQSGLTLRIMEGLLFNKKIVTTNQFLSENKDFRNCSNIFILNQNNITGLQTFLKKPTQEYPLNIKKKYSFDEWLERLINKEEAK
nr:hypothetical protein [Prevotella sp.]